MRETHEELIELLAADTVDQSVSTAAALYFKMCALPPATGSAAAIDVRTDADCALLLLITTHQGNKGQA